MKVFIIFGWLVVFFCLCGFYSCDAGTGEQKAEERNYEYYAFEKKVVLTRPLRCYAFFCYEVSGEYAGSILQYGTWERISRKLFDGKDYVDLPVGTEVIVKDFWIRWFGELEESGKSEHECYFLGIIVPQKPEWEDRFVYFMGYDHKLAFPFWEDDNQQFEKKIFGPNDIEDFFPGGCWL